MSIDHIALFVCRLGFAGLSPRAPGTCGTAVAAILAPWCFLPWSLPVRGAMLLLVFVVGALAASRAERVLACKDPGQIVIDELLGLWIVLWPFAAPSWLVIVLAFAAFRFFDIVKIWPVKASESWLAGGWGVMIDDVLAGVQALVLVWLIVMWGGLA